MFGMINAFWSVIGTVTDLLTLGALGAVAGLVCWGASRLLGGMTGLLASVALGAAVVIAGAGSGFMTAKTDCANQAAMNQLRLEKARLEQELRVEREAAVVQDEIVADQQDALDDNLKVLSTLDEIIASHPDSDGCVITPQELEAIDALR